VPFAERVETVTTSTSVHRIDDVFDELLASIDTIPSPGAPSAEPKQHVEPEAKQTKNDVDEETVSDEGADESDKPDARELLIEGLTKLTDDLVAMWTRDPDAAPVYDYLQQHYGWSVETIERARIGWDDGCSALRLRRAGMTEGELLATGHFHGKPGHVRSAFDRRIVFPWLDPKGRTLFEAGRATLLTKRWERDGKDITPKYVKSRLHKEDEDDGISPHLVQPIWLGPDADKKHDLGIIAEGVADAISAVQAGYPTISPVTTRFSRDQVPQLLSITARWGTVCLVPDQEANGSGMAGAIAVADELFAAGRDVRIVVLPHEHLVGKENWKIDLNEFLAAEGLIKAAVRRQPDEDAGDLMVEMRERRERELKALIATTPTYLAYRVAQIPTPIDPMRWTETVRPVLKLVASRKDVGERTAWIEKLVERGVGKLGDMKKALAEEVMARNAATITTATAASDYQHTDLGNAQRLHARLRNRVHYVSEWASWIAWDGHVWVRDRRGHRVRGLAAKMVQEELSKETDPEVRGFWVSCQSRHALDNCVALLADQPGIEIASALLDAKPQLFNCENGSLDLSRRDGTGRMPYFRPHDPKDLLTFIADVKYDTHAYCREWAEAREITHPDPEVRRYLQKRAGYYLSGEVHDESFELDFGPKGTGKSTYYRTLANVLNRYAIVAPKTLFERQRVEQHPTNRMTLRGVRLAYGVEIGGRLDHDTIKGITGRDRIVARGMNQDFQEFPQTHKLVAFTNTKPTINAGTDDGIWDRLRIVPWEVPIRGTALDNPTLSEQLRTPEALSGILTWMVEGWIALDDEGDAPPDVVRARTNALAKEADSIVPFLEDCCVVDPKASITEADLWEARKTWNEEAGERAHEKSRDFIDLVLKHEGITRATKKCPKTRRLVLNGVRLRTTDDKDDAAPSTSVAEASCASTAADLDADGEMFNTDILSNV
jgi:putative DNA primase/helicase